MSHASEIRSTAAPPPPVVTQSSETAALLGAPVTCANCHAPLSGHFCSQCGAPRIDERPLTVRRFVNDLWNELTSVDSGTMRTLRVLFRHPGLLTKEYVSGRTRWYLSPLRLYLLLFGALVFAEKSVGMDEKVADKVRQKLQQKAATDANFARINSKSVRGGSGGMIQASASTAQSMMTNQWLHLGDPLAVALVLMVLYRRFRRNYAAHVVMALHVLAFSSGVQVVTMVVRGMLNAVPDTFDAISVIYWAVLGTYFYFAARRVYEQSRAKSGVKSVLFVAGAQVAMMVVPLLTMTVMAVWIGVRTALAH